ncbi:hypothetical protein EDD21DRAFT_438819 [Dissophora ornata]|nr:hypothetical protein EDD21DRAFT_438819 [Dissophora ornata]
MADYTLQQRFLKASSFKMRSTTSMMATRGLLWIIPSSRPAMFLFSLYSFADTEHIDFTNFVTHFGLTNRESATKSFEDLLQSTRIPSKRRFADTSAKLEQLLEREYEELLRSNDVRAKALEQGLLWGELAGPIQARNNAKDPWDTFKLVRYGKAFAIAAVSESEGRDARGRSRTFIISTGKEMVPALVATLPTLELLKAC